jgi:hypothetical protein
MIFRGGEGRRTSCAIKHRSGGLVMLRIEYSYSSLSHWPLEGSGMAQSTVEESVAPTACSASVFRAWCAARGASASQTRRILTLLDLQHFLSLPLPPRTHRLPGVPDWKWGRFLIRRHIQHILLWRERRGEGSANGFSDDLNWIIRRQLFLHPAARDDGEDARRGEGDSQRTSATNVTRSVAPTTEEEEDPVVLDLRVPTLEEDITMQHHVSVMGAGLLLDSQEPRQVSRQPCTHVPISYSVPWNSHC